MSVQQPLLRHVAALTHPLMTRHVRWVNCMHLELLKLSDILGTATPVSAGTAYYSRLIRKEFGLGGRDGSSS